MTREIKFRAWDDLLNTMNEVRLFKLPSPEFTDPSIKIMQYTGLKDKNGKEIYEGDILLIPDTYTNVITDDGRGPTEPENHLSEVIFGEGSFGVNVKESLEILLQGKYSFKELNTEINLKEIEIIGNIYQDKHLLDNTDTKV